MDEKLQELLYAVQRAASDFSDAACAAGRRANEWVQNGRAKVQILDLRTEINVHLKEIGQIVYNTHTGTPTESEVLFAKLAEIDQLNARIAELESQCAGGQTACGEEADFVVEDYQEPSETVACPACGAAVRKGDRFCRECGEALSE